MPVNDSITIKVASPDLRQTFASKISKFLNACGYFETVNVTFADSIAAEIFGGPSASELSVREELRAREQIFLRDNLIGSLMQVLRLNMNMKTPVCRTFLKLPPHSRREQVSFLKKRQKWALYAIAICESFAA